jgi:hypothetical protein
MGFITPYNKATWLPKKAKSSWSPLLKRGEEKKIKTNCKIFINYTKSFD